MPNLTVCVKHRLTVVEARRRVQMLMGELRRRLARHGQMQWRWKGNTLAFTLIALNMEVEGHVFLKRDVVRLKVVLPWLLAPLVTSLTDDIENQARELLHRP